MNERILHRFRDGPHKADSDHVRRQNRALVLSALRRQAPVARVDLGALTQLSPATITAITADLIAEGLVQTVADEMTENGEGADTRGRRGRPRILLQLDPTAVYVLGVKIAINTVTLALADFSGAVVALRALTPDTRRASRHGFALTLAAMVRDLLAAEHIALTQVAEIAVAAQGFVDVNSGSVMWSPAFAESDMRIVAPLEAELGIPCTIGNDANMIAQALHAQDPQVYGGTFAVVFVDYGVGMGLFIGDRLHAGANGSAAEFGHMNHMPNGPLCRCGRRGCIEAFTADYAINRDARGLPPDTPPGDARPTPGDLVALEAAAYAGDERIRAVYARAGAVLGYGLARLMALINPSRIVFTGASTRAFPLIEPAMKEAIEAALVEDLRRSTVFESLPWERDMILVGVVADALARLDRDVLSSPTNAARFRA